MHLVKTGVKVVEEKLLAAAGISGNQYSRQPQYCFTQIRSLPQEDAPVEWWGYGLDRRDNFPGLA